VGVNPRTSADLVSQPWRGWISSLYCEFIIQPLQGCQGVCLSLPWVAPTVIEIKPLRGNRSVQIKTRWRYLPVRMCVSATGRKSRERALTEPEGTGVPGFLSI